MPPRESPGRPRVVSGPLDDLIDHAGSGKRLAELLNVSDRTVYEWNGRRSKPDDESFARIVSFCRKNALEIPVF